MKHFKQDDISLIWSSEKFSLIKKITYYHNLKIENISSAKEYEYFLETYFWDLNFFFMKFNSILLKFVYLSEKRKKKYLNIKTSSEYPNISNILTKKKEAEYISLIHTIIGEDGIGKKKSQEEKKILKNNNFFELFNYILKEIPSSRKDYYIKNYYHFFIIYETLIRNLSSHGYLKSLFQLKSIYYSEYFNKLFLSKNISNNGLICFTEQQSTLIESDNFLYTYINNEQTVNLIESSRIRKLLNIINFNNELNFGNLYTREIYFKNKTNKFPKFILYNCDQYLKEQNIYPLNLTFDNILSLLLNNKKRFISYKNQQQILSYFRGYSYDNIFTNSKLQQYISSINLPFNITHFNECINLISLRNKENLEKVFVNFFLNYYTESYDCICDSFLKFFINNISDVEGFKSIIKQKNKESLLKQYFQNHFNGYFLGSTFNNFIPTHVMKFCTPQRGNSSYINIFSAFNKISKFIKDLENDLKI